ncbi:MAG: MFS transporter [Bdellovibrionota bacterium]
MTSRVECASEESSLRPSIVYSLMYFALNAANAVSLAFFPLHCKHLGFSPFKIALISAASNIGTILGAPGFTALAHYAVPARKILRVCSLGCVALYLPLLVTSYFPLLIALWLMFAICWSGCNVCVDTRAIRESLAGRIRFERVRIWGSIGFIVSLTVLGQAVDRIGVESIVVFGLLFAGAIALAASPLLPRLAAATGLAAEERSGSSIRSIPGRGCFFMVLVAVALCWTSHGALYVYFSIYLRALGWSGSMISVAWDIGVVAEVILFMCFARIAERVSLVRILQTSAALTVLRWLILSSTADPEIILSSQVLHAFSFGSFYLASLKLVHQILPPDFRDRGQGFLSGFGSGLGSLSGRVIFGALASGIPDAVDYHLLFRSSAVLAVLSFTAASAAVKLHRPHVTADG